MNADDFGRSPGINQGIIRSHENGIVTSASLMVGWRAAAEAAAYARRRPVLSAGLHLDLCEWSHLSGAWQKVYEVVPLNNFEAVAKEIARQLAEFRKWMGQEPTHLDSHQHVHRAEPVLGVL